MFSSLTYKYKSNHHIFVVPCIAHPPSGSSGGVKIVPHVSHNLDQGSGYYKVQMKMVKIVNNKKSSTTPLYVMRLIPLVPGVMIRISNRELGSSL